MSFGPRREPGGVSPEVAAAASLAAEFYEDGRNSVLHGGYASGHDLGHDVGYGADNDADRRGFVRGVLEGHAKGLEARRELLAALSEPEQEAQAG